jgi:hypothetical protein
VSRNPLHSLSASAESAEDSLDTPAKGYFNLEQWVNQRRVGRRQVVIAQ